MRQYTADNLVVRAGSRDDGVIVELRPEETGLAHLSFVARRAGSGQSWEADTGPHELALVVLGGCLDVGSNRGAWEHIGRRARVFDGLPSALYLPRHTSFRVTARTECEFAAVWTPAARDFPPRVVLPRDVSVELRGGDNASRQINSIIPPGFACDRLVVVEVYTPGGNWSSYPPHKHDVHKSDLAGNLVEADLDELYYYRIDPPHGFALQRIYTDPQSPLQRAGFQIDAAVVARDHDVVLVPEGYHPVSSPFGYTSYYLNVLAGSAQSLACSDDPQHSWVKEHYRTRDPRVPIYNITEAKQS